MLQTGWPATQISHLSRSERYAMAYGFVLGRFRANERHTADYLAGRFAETWSELDSTISQMTPTYERWLITGQV